MTELEFDVLDELYFVLSYQQLAEACELEEQELVDTLTTLYEKGWVKVLQTVDDEAQEPLELQTQFHTYYYLATKKGLHAHNLG